MPLSSIFSTLHYGSVAGTCRLHACVKDAPLCSHPSALGRSVSAEWIALLLSAARCATATGRHLESATQSSLPVRVHKALSDGKGRARQRDHRTRIGKPFPQHRRRMRRRRRPRRPTSLVKARRWRDGASPRGRWLATRQDAQADCSAYAPREAASAAGPL